MLLSLLTERQAPLEPLCRIHTTASTSMFRIVVNLYVRTARRRSPSLTETWNVPQIFPRWTAWSGRLDDPHGDDHALPSDPIEPSDRSS
ncbi:hypothetical protein [Actinomadura rudentiformis]|uniref:Uncharacterized protein n=1 Tax=Actinomadura rudentiformis TaxID=359158 RepID=A0A6H9YVQ7_9ACTN|nr:hypothetical protein [Actinomadura rudentiformis]KAB2348856.1 hypothetical protein F8566_13870 [Actinomadura rudentiformis]